jgi:hypothetical protein
MTLIKSISGIRGTIGGATGDTLNPLAIVKFTTAYATFIPRKTGKIVVGRDGCGSMLQDGESTRLVCRFSEFSILDDTTTVCNNRADLAIYGKSVVGMPDIIQVSCSSGSYTASFESGAMYTAYGSSSVPSGWLVPLSYVKVGRPQSPSDQCAKVRLIVPHSQGHATASSNVAPYYYEITYQRES